MNGFERVTAFFESQPVLETQTPLAAGASIPSNTIDTVDFLGARSSNIPFGGGLPGYVIDPGTPDPRYHLDYLIFAIGAAGAVAPGDLLISTGPVDGTGAPGAINRSRHVPYNGHGGIFDRTGQLTVNQGNWYLTGSMRLAGRFLFVTYKNAHVAQLTFELGVYLRAI